MERIAALIINMPKRSLSIEIQEFFDSLEEGLESSTKGAFSLQRTKLFVPPGSSRPSYCVWSETPANGKLLSARVSPFSQLLCCEDPGTTASSRKSIAGSWFNRIPKFSF